MRTARTGVATLGAAVFLTTTGLSAASAAGPVALEPVVVQDALSAYEESVYGLAASNAGVLVSGSTLLYGEELVDRRQVGDLAGDGPTELAGARVLTPVTTYDGTANATTVHWADLDGTDAGEAAAQGGYLTATPVGWAEAVLAADGSIRAVSVDVTTGSPVRTELGVVAPRPTAPNPFSSWELQLSADASADALVISVPRSSDRLLLHRFGTSGLVPLPALPAVGASGGSMLSLSGSTVSALRYDHGSSGSGGTASVIDRLKADGTGWHEWRVLGAQPSIHTAVDATLWLAGDTVSAGPADGSAVRTDVLPGASAVAVDDSGRVLTGTRGGAVSRRAAALSGTATTVFQTGKAPLRVRGVDLSLGEVAWIDDSVVESPVWSRSLTTATGKAQVGAKAQVLQRASGFSLARWSGDTARLTEQDVLAVRDAKGQDRLYPDVDPYYGGRLMGSGRYLLAGQSLLDVVTGATVRTLPGTGALSGDRLAWLDGRGSVWTSRLPDGPPQQLAAPLLPEDASEYAYAYGELAVAGDRVAWTRLAQDFTTGDNAVDWDVAWADARGGPVTDLADSLPPGSPGTVVASGRRFAVETYGESYEDPPTLSVFEFGQLAPQATVRTGYGWYDTDLFADALAWLDTQNRVVVSALPPLVTPFDDVAGSPFAADVAWLVERGVTSGYVREDGMPEFRPATAVSRQAMAAFLFRYAAPSSYVPPATPTFADVPVSHPFRTQIEWLASRGVTTGTLQPDGSKLFKSGDAVSRQAMAAFLYRYAGSPAFSAPATASFADVPTGAPFAREVEWLASTGISGGSLQTDGSRLFKPADAVSRQAMAAFLHRYDSRASA